MKETKASTEENVPARCQSKVIDLSAAQHSGLRKKCSFNGGFLAQRKAKTLLTTYAMKPPFY